ASDAATIFFEKLLESIKTAVYELNLPKNLFYSISVPASFEANQRRDLVRIINKAGYPVKESCLIDEPNAAFLSYCYLETQRDIDDKLVDFINDKKKVNILVYDFGAGTCDISVLEIKCINNSFSSRNMAISRFTALGGDDIDRDIARTCLLDQLLQSNTSYEPERRHIEEILIPRLMPAAEALKIQAIEYISNRKMSTIGEIRSIGEEIFFTNGIDKFKIMNNQLFLESPSMALNQLADVLERYAGKYNPKIDFNKKHVYAPVDEVLTKIGMKAKDLDAILFIGGSSKNPIIRHTIMENLPSNVMELIPEDLQIHVSLGATLHSLFFNAYSKDLIKPITPERIYAKTTTGLETIIEASTEVPTERPYTKVLQVANDNQQIIEVPICVGNQNKIIGSLDIHADSNKGYKKGTKVKVSASITHDKLLVVEAEVCDNKIPPTRVKTELLNPLANNELTPKEEMLLKARQKFNIALLQYGAANIPTICITNYADAARDAEDYEKAAELYATAERKDKKLNYANDIGCYYSWIGNKKSAEKWFIEAYRRNKNEYTCSNLAIYQDNIQNKISLLRESLEHNPDYAIALYSLGNILHEQNSPEGKACLKHYVTVMQRKILNKSLKTYEINNLKYCADILQMDDLLETLKEYKTSTSSISDPTSQSEDGSNLLASLNDIQAVTGRGRT
ncbi:MAG: Hsp70 family protein, partial [Endomicrobium sp.]|nr:Hsp70 family protein [Endomicrobium sp.]